jgi:DNA mismatch endonuclease (patch repair protein)
MMPSALPPRTVNLGGGRAVPYPEPSSAAATRIGKANRRAGTKPEEALRRELHRLGLRFRKDRYYRASDAHTHIDVAFGPVRVAVFMDGCFWHACPEHFQMPQRNVDYWEPKIAANVARDGRVDAALEADGWTVVHVWEHEPIDRATRRVVTILDGLGHAPASRALTRLGSP